MSGEHLPEPRCAYCGKVLEVSEPVVLMVPNRPIRRLRYGNDEDLRGGIAVHERCYEEREPTFDD